MASKKLTPKQQKFIDEYLISLNATDAAIKAGYSAKTAFVIGHENLNKPYIKEIVDSRLKEHHNNRIMTLEEVLENLTKIANGEIEEDAVTSAGIVKKGAAVRDRTKALELLGKRFGAFTDKIDVSGGISIQFVDDIPEE